MKTKTLLSLAATFLFFINSSFARPDEKRNAQRTMAISVENYVQTLKQGYNQNYEALIADDAHFNINRGGKIISHDKNEELKFAKQHSAPQNCEISYAVITSSESYALVNVSMKYENFTRENIVSLAKEINGWKIKEVNSVFK